MSNSLIPYSFTPGTKAKAQEVNANFIALAEKIEQTIETTNQKFAETEQKIEQTNSQSEEKKCDKNLGNTTLITNCVLEAPNGVIDVYENVITVKEGLKVMIPNGLNADGSVNSIIYEVAEDVELTLPNNTDCNCVYVTPNGCGYANAYVNSDLEPAKKFGLWYKPTENKMYLYNGDMSEWQEISALVIALYTINDAVITVGEIVKPVRLLTTTDRLSVMNWIAPDYTNSVDLQWGGTYTAQKNGWVYCTSVGQVGAWQRLIINGKSFYTNWVRNGDQAGSCACFIVKKGDTYKGEGHYYIARMYFIPMEGEV